jgi:DNA-binding transcriptional MerR regulator
MIPAKRYFTIGEVGELCGVKPHVLRYWEQEFTQLRPVKRRGNRRYYQHHEVLMIRRIRDLLYDQGFTISGARNKMQELVHADRELARAMDGAIDGVEVIELDAQGLSLPGPSVYPAEQALPSHPQAESSQSAEHGIWLRQMRAELLDLRDLLHDAI